MRDECEVSVVIPTRDRWSHLSLAGLPSALEQAKVDHEVIVVDDGSSDATSTRLADLRHSRLRVIRNDRSQGVASARNAGIRAARGRWVSFLDDDDVWAPLKLRTQLDAMLRSDASFAYSAGVGIDSMHNFLFAVAPPDPATITAQLLRWNVIWCGCSNVVAQTALVRDLGAFDESLFQLADWDLWIRLALAGRAAMTPEILVGYAMHSESMLLTDRRDVFPELDYLVEKHRAASATYGIEFDRTLFARWVARGHRLAGRRGLAAWTYLAAAVRHADPGAVPRAVGSLLPEAIFDLGGRLSGSEGRSILRKLAEPEPEWLARFQT